VLLSSLHVPLALLGPEALSYPDGGTLPSMPSKKKSKRKSTARPAKKVRRSASKAGVGRKSTKKKSTRKSTKKKTTRTQPVSRPKAKKRSKASVSSETDLKREFQRRNLTASGIRSPRRSADFKGSSRAEQADSQSVDELVEEGNLFEAGAVAGVEEADDADEREVQTHEVSEDDVPDEYLDKE
jgi:hypothetical protein